MVHGDKDVLESDLATLRQCEAEGFFTTKGLTLFRFSPNSKRRDVSWPAETTVIRTDGAATPKLRAAPAPVAASAAALALASPSAGFDLRSFLGESSTPLQSKHHQQQQHHQHQQATSSSSASGSAFSLLSPPASQVLLMPASARAIASLTTVASAADIAGAEPVAEEDPEQRKEMLRLVTDRICAAQ